MTYWEMMTEDVRSQIINKFEPMDIDDFIEEMGLSETVDDYEKYLDEFGCFRCMDIIVKTENGKIVKTYYMYEIIRCKQFGNNNELLLIAGAEEVAVINRNTLDEVVHMYTQ